MDDQKLSFGHYLESLEEAEVKAIAGRIRPWRGGEGVNLQERRTAIAEAVLELRLDGAGPTKTRAQWTLLLEEKSQTALWRLGARERSSWWAKHAVSEARLNKDAEPQSIYDSTAGGDLDPEAAWLAAEEAADRRRDLILNLSRAVTQAVAELVDNGQIAPNHAQAFQRILLLRTLAPVEGETMTWEECCQQEGAEFSAKRASHYWKLCEKRFLELARGNAGE